MFLHFQTSLNGNVMSCVVWILSRFVPRFYCISCVSSSCKWCGWLENEISFPNVHSWVVCVLFIHRDFQLIHFLCFLSTATFRGGLCVHSTSTHCSLFIRLEMEIGSVGGWMKWLLDGCARHGWMVGWIR